MKIAPQNPETPATEPPAVEVFYDGLCPLCSREIRLLKSWDKQQRVRFTDISAVDFDPSNVGRTMPQLMREIHGRLPGGELIAGVEVFREIYSAMGFHRTVRFSRWPLVSQSLDLGYRIFAPIRLRLAGGCDDSGRCQLPTQN